MKPGACAVCFLVDSYAHFSLAGATIKNVPSGLSAVDVLADGGGPRKHEVLRIPFAG